MLIVCPACASEYRIEADRVGMEGRSVRCAACREAWFVSPADVLAGRSAELEAEWEAAASPTGSGPEAGAPAGGPIVENVPPRPAP
ncbi:MJ0042-type zinc finger domain-containing protein, partial [Methylobacterium segetis]|uniref:MJ0042-type zinc finger domain-containing protein n=1 Tax=Methylobacterium segetis TaxID=2488750 RepID=UPI001A9E1D14